MKKPELVFVGKSSFPTRKSVSTHMHTCMEIVLYVSCNGTTIIGDKAYSIKSGDIAVINPSTPHNETHFEKAKVLFFGIENNESLPTLSQGVYSKVDGFERLNHIVERISNEVKNQDFGHEQIISAMLVEFVVLFGRIIRSVETFDRSLDYCANYLRENYAKQINMEDFSKSYGFDYERFRRDFKQIYGIAPKQFVIEQRLLNAYSMIFETGYSCTDIAMYCGFSDSSQFSKMFKKRYGVSPEKLRTNKKQIL